tara:strand:- start:247 stop:549 length:303 start_codon:yes stop_codon:yes gene_type:complete
LEFIDRDGFVNKIYNKKEYLCLSYLLLPEFWNQGYGSEVVKEMVITEFNELNQDEILVYINVLNLASQKLLRKFNPKLIDVTEHLDMNFFRYILTKSKIK